MALFQMIISGMASHNSTLTAAERSFYSDDFDDNDKTLGQHQLLRM
jgi:hypothetical protein